MNPNPSTRCPCHAAASDGAAPVQAPHPPGVWPPGPPSGLTGWSHLRRMAKDPLGLFASLRERYGDIVHLRIWPEHQVVVSSPERVRELLVDHHEDLIRWERGIQVFSQLHGRSVLVAEGEAWKSKRRALQPSFSPKAVRPFVASIADAAIKAISQWPGDDDWPIESALTSLAMDVILRMMFSSEIDEEARAAEQAVHTASVVGNAELYWPASWPDWMPWKRSKRQALSVLNRLIDRHIQDRLALDRAAWPDDLLGHLLGAHRADPAVWPLSAVRDECMTTFLAGHETVAATLTWWAWCMASNPQAQATARREVLTVLKDRPPTADDVPSLAYLAQTLQETLRLYPALPLLFTRRAVRPITLGAWQLPARTLFIVPVHLLHHDPRWFPDPQVYRPERFAAESGGVPRGAFLPFGTGPRACLGQYQAMAEMTVIAAVLLQRFELGVPQGMAAPTPVLNITMRPERGLRLRLAERAPG